jgi:Na+/H+ antiporter NhaC
MTSFPARAALSAVVVIALLMVSASGARELPATGHFGAASLLPATAAILLAFTTRQVLFALLTGIAMGGVVVGDVNVLTRFMLPAIGSAQYALILVVYLWCLGGLLGLWTRTGGAVAFSERVRHTFVRGRISAKVFAWVMGLVFHQGGTISTVLAGTTVRPVTDRHNVSHEELSYIVDSTASPVAALIPLNVWPIYVAGFAAGTIPLLPDQASAVSFFYRSIPYNFYALFAVLLTLGLALEWLPWRGRQMDRAIERARSGGGLNRPGSSPLVSAELTASSVPDGYQASPIDFIVPIVTLIGFALGSWLVTGSVMIAEAFGLGVLMAAGLAWIRGLPLAEIIDGVIDGCKGVTAGAILLGLAVTLGAVSQQLGTATYIVEAASQFVIPVLLPAILMAICMVVAFSIGSSFGTFAVIFPLAIPLAWSVSTDPAYISLCFASVVGGSLFGDQCSPVSDTTILSSLACSADLMDHVTTQLPLALVAAGLAAMASTVVAIVVL